MPFAWNSRPNLTCRCNLFEVTDGLRHMKIRLDDLSGAAVIRLLQEHLSDVRSHSPPESSHALDLDGLRAPDITFWSVWEDGELLGCGALKELDPYHGEIKSMRTVEAHRRRGVAAHLVQHLVAEARRRSYRRLSLETGSMEAFSPARDFYCRFGFEFCEPFAGYIKDPNSVFMTRELK